MTTSEIGTILTEAITRSVGYTEIVSVGVACDISELMSEVHALLDDGEDADYVRDNDGRYDVWAFREDAPEGQMLWRLSVLCGDSDA